MPVYVVHYKYKDKKDHFVMIADSKKDAEKKAAGILEAMEREEADISKIKEIDL